MKIRQSIKRKLVQIVAFGYSNAHIANMKTGKLYTGKWKQFCNPGMNCYSCPAAGLACPIGALQAVNGSMKYNFSFYVIGLILAFGVIFGRFICGWLCPFGLVQELLHRIPSPKFKLPSWCRYIKYLILVVFVILMPIFVTNFMGMGSPAFCQYICPIGTLEGGIPLLVTHPELRMMMGKLFSLKMAILIGTLIGCATVYRFFCKTMCPLGAIYGLMNKISFYHLEIDHDKCVKCNQCAKSCGMDVSPWEHPNDMECIRCGACVKACPTQAITMGFKSMKERQKQ